MQQSERIGKLFSMPIVGRQGMSWDVSWIDCLPGDVPIKMVILPMSGFSPKFSHHPNFTQRYQSRLRRGVEENMWTLHTNI